MGSNDSNRSSGIYKLTIKNSIGFLTLFLILGGILIIAYKNGVTLNNLSNDSIGSYSSYQQLKSQLSIDFSIPEFLLSEEGLTYKSYNKSMAEISNNRVRFVVGTYPDIDISIVGDYNTYDIDERYNVNLGDDNWEYLRYRGDSKTAVLEYTIGDLMYGIKLTNFDGINGMEAAINEIGLTYNQLELIIDEDIKKSDIPSQSSKDEEGLGDSDVELSYMGKVPVFYNEDTKPIETFKLDIPDWNISMELPFNTESILISSDENVLNIVYCGKIIMKLQYGNSLNLANGIIVEGLDKGYSISYSSVNPFDTDTPEYDNYELLLSNIGEVINSIDLTKASVINSKSDT